MLLFALWVGLSGIAYLVVLLAARFYRHSPTWRLSFWLTLPGTLAMPVFLSVVGFSNDDRSYGFAGLALLALLVASAIGGYRSSRTSRGSRAGSR